MYQFPVLLLPVSLIENDLAVSVLSNSKICVSLASAFATDVAFVATPDDGMICRIREGSVLVQLRVISTDVILNEKVGDCTEEDSLK